MPSRQKWEFRGVVRMTGVGTAYLLSTIVLAMAAVNTGNNAIYIGVSLMLGCLLLSGIASKGGLKHLEVEIGGIGEAWAGRPAEGTLRIRNRSRIWNVRDVVFTSESFAEPLVVAVIPRRSDFVVPVSFLFSRRGVAHLAGVDSYTRYPFGFFLKKRRLRAESDAVVYPALLAASEVAERFRAVTGDLYSANRPGPGSEIHSFREYTRGDSLRHVYWKKSASLGRWIIKQTESESARSVDVVVDPYRPRSVSEEAFEAMVSEAATFLDEAAARGADITLSIGRVTVRTRSGESPSPLFRALALLEPVFEPVDQPLGRDTVLFSVGGRHDAKSA